MSLSSQHSVATLQLDPLKVLPQHCCVQCTGTAFLFCWQTNGPRHSIGWHQLLDGPWPTCTKKIPEWSQDYLHRIPSLNICQGQIVFELPQPRLQFSIRVSSLIHVRLRCGLTCLQELLCMTLCAHVSVCVLVGR